MKDCDARVRSDLVGGNAFYNAGMLAQELQVSLFMGIKEKLLCTGLSIRKKQFGE